jgi:SPP1 family predicted phage head-tail adaptor
MDPGRLRHRVTFEEAHKTPDGGGGYTTKWEDVYQGLVWAAVEPLSGAERVRAMQVYGSVTHRITVRYRLGIKPAMRLMYGGRVLNITSAPIDIGERRAWLEFYAVEEV